MPENLKTVFLEGMDVSIESFILSRPSASKQYLISAACECLRQERSGDSGAVSSDPIRREGLALIAAYTTRQACPETKWCCSKDTAV